MQLIIEGTSKYVDNMPYAMKHPEDSSRIINVLYSGETFNGVPDGMGKFTWNVDASNNRKC